MKVGLIGGGRWSRVLVTCLQHLSTPPQTIYWVTQHGLAQSQKLVTEKGWQNVTFLNVESELPLADLDGAIVATAPHTHTSYAKSLIDAGVPTLVEKPVSLSYSEAHELMVLAEARQCPVGVNVEFSYASYLADFRRDIELLTPEHVAIDWVDPTFEERYGEIKMGQFYTPMIHDILPHVWSLIKTLWPDSPLTAITSVDYDRTTAITIEACAKKFNTTVTLWRRGPERLRRIAINGGKAILDFSSEPGHSVVEGKTQAYEWHGERPLNAALGEFAHIMLNPKADWTLALRHHLPSAQLTESAYDQFREKQDRLISDHDVNDPHFKDQADAWLIDRYLPDLTRQGKRINTQTPKDLALCADYIRKYCLA